MKELSMEEKVRAYNEALKKAREWYVDAQIDFKKSLEALFPELKESEDERIRKALINGFKDYNGWDEEWFDGITVRNAIAWLEKRGEPIDEEKVLIGAKKDVALSIMNFLNRNTLSMCLSNIECADLECAVIDSDWSKVYDYMKKKLEKQGEQKPVDKPKFKVGDWVVTDMNSIIQIKAVNNVHYTIDNGGVFNVYYVDKCWHLWTIQDAKDGDVLVDYREKYDNQLIFILKKFEHVNFGLVRPSDYSSYCSLTAGDIQMFKEGDYHYKHNIKPATKKQRDLLFQKMREASYEWDSEKKELKKIIDEKQIKKNLQDNSFRRMLEQKPAWSEEDTKMFVNIKACLRNANKDYSRELDWLKSLRDIVWLEMQGKKNSV